MNKVVLVPGLAASTFTLHPLRAELEAAGFEVEGAFYPRRHKK